MRWLSQNYQWIFSGIGVLFLALLIERWRKSRQRIAHSAAALTAQGSKVISSPVASGHGISQIVNSPTVNVSLPAPPPTPLEEVKEQPPCLSFVQPRSVLLHQGNAGVWHEASTDLQYAHRGLVAQFRNHPNKVGETAPKANSVTASLIFRSPETPDQLLINHAVWLGRYEHVASFRSGETHQLLLAVKLIPFVTYDNPNSSNPFAHRMRSGMSIREPKPFTLGKEGEVEITLVDTWNVTVFSGVFEYRLSAEEMYLKQKT